jgi:hypothetical protein
MSNDIDAMVVAAERRGQRSLRTEPRARAARYARRANSCCLE